MKTPIIQIFNLGIVLCVMSCTDDNMYQSPIDNGGKMPLVISAAYPTVTRATDAGFEHGDKMGVYVMDYENDKPQDISSDEIHAANLCFEFNNSDNTWKSNCEIYWTSPNIPADIIGYYPYSNAVENPHNHAFSISRRQDVGSDANNPGGYETSDFLWAKSEKTMPTNSKIDLSYQHLMAGVRVTLKEGEGFANGEWNDVEKNVIIPDILPNTCIDLSTGDLSPASGNPSSIIAYQYGYDWRAIVVPQIVSQGKNVIDITVDNVSYHLKKEQPIEYIGGKLTTFTITVNKKASSGTYEFILTDEAIINWIDDIDFRGSVILNYTIVNVPQRGSLKEMILQNGFEEASIANLKITGEINEKDFQFIRDNMEVLSNLNLKDATVYEGEEINKIPDSALAGKKTLTTVIFPMNLKIIGNNAFAHTGLIGDLTIPEGVTHIGTNLHEGYNGGGYGAFRNCQSLTGNLSLPKSLLYIEAGAFLGAPLSGILSLPDKLEYIGGSAFENCKFSGELKIPESVTDIGESAFANNSFSGNLKIPSNIRIVRQSVFKNAFSSGTLQFHDDITEILYSAFSGCNFKGELKLPKRLKTLGNCAFYETNYSSIVFNDELVSIGSMCFGNNSRLSGTLELPKQLTEINFGTFEDCPLLEEVVIGENITKIGANAFGNCYNLKSIIVNNPEPPIFNNRYDYADYREPFEGVPMDNFTVQVPRESVDIYRQTKGWKEFKRIAAYSGFICRPSTVCALTTSHEETLIINSDGPWEITHIPEWCNVSKTSGNGKTELILSISKMSKGNGDRTDFLEFSLKNTDFTTRCDVSQYDYQFDEDECVTLQSHTKGTGIDILFIGDGFDGKTIANGSYMELVKTQMEAFFGVEPYSSYREYFNVYSCVSLSQETGVNTAHTWRNTRFMTLYNDTEDNPTLLHDDTDLIFDYATEKSPLTKDKLAKSLIIMTLNSDEYGGATTLRWDGASISICSNSSDPYPMDVRGILQHEACGHGFGKLADEKISENRYIKSSEIDYVNDFQSRGWFQNISLTGKLNEVLWNSLIFDTRYSDKVDVFEGGFGVTRGVYRAEINSCMNYGIPYFSAAARMDIMKRILEYSGEEFTMEKFYATDSDKWGSTGSTRAGIPAEADAYVNSGMHHPVRFVKSNKY